MGDNITQNDYFDKGLDIIQRAKEVRKDTNKTQDLLDNALFRLSQTPDSEMWQNEKSVREEKLKSLQDEFSVLETELHYLKGNMDEDFYKLLLQQYGTMLAATSHIDHVKDCMYDEYELSKALSATTEAIKIKSKELEKALEEGNEDYAIILNAELRFFRSDMKNHHWGIDRLELLDKENIEKQGKSK